ncbi:DNA mismatch repair protein [Vibrio sp. IB15]|uniref:DNA mismatch repair protein n=1 Tax=Vibrio chagasii TaxID=170679 RepID=A0A7V7NQ22_9VIBR|nr:MULTISPECIES: DNA mismatch repair protein [Vibrio]KAB0470302.1 DNA mismatch repair protein [Vibrio chagasii]MBJ2145713.1 DNA mismatch repair protein [Vibrio sp. IB15]CAH6890870.1 DNA mismatch repair protein [Vibrio chagasii]CAH7227148.1 DNA mismatch repair protein [Vibrio chagasii]CAH7256920.1 DNA mismatch repair protein [Vibrio chagasii]
MALRLPPPWMIVLTGLVLNILAIVVSSLVLDKMVVEQAQYRERQQGNVYSIQLAWNTIETLERKRESMLLHMDISTSSNSAVTPELEEAMRGQLGAWVSGKVPEITVENLSQIMMLINQAQQSQRTRIDDFYLDNLTLSERLQALEEQMTLYKNIALFLQIFGLALILARDLARRN